MPLAFNFFSTSSSGSCDSSGVNTPILMDYLVFIYAAPTGSPGRSLPFLYCAAGMLLRCDDADPGPAQLPGAIPIRRRAGDARVDGAHEHRLGRMTARLGTSKRFSALVLESEGDFVGGDGAFAEDHPGVAAAGEVDDGGGDGAGGRATVDDEGDLVAELLEHALAGRTLGHSAEIGGGRGDGKAQDGYD